MKIIKKMTVLFILFNFSSCAGYHFRQVQNPFSHFGIESISVPMFVNKSIVPNVSSIFTKEIHLLLSRYSGLNVYSGMRTDTDAVLLGIVSSSPRMTDVFGKNEQKLISEDLLSGRKPFYVSSSTLYRLNLRIVLLKRPDQRLIKFIHGPLGDYAQHGPQIVLDESFPLTSTFTRAGSGQDSRDPESRRVNFTKSKAWFRITLKELAKSTAEKIRKEVLNAF